MFNKSNVNLFNDTIVKLFNVNVTDRLYISK